MKNKITKSALFIITLFVGITIGFFIRHNNASWHIIKSTYKKNNTINEHKKWNREFKIFRIKSTLDNKIQKSYYYKSKSNSPQPLIVSLHTWSGDYKKYDELAQLCLEKDLNYIHPDFRGSNSTTEACSSNLALADIDDAITYALNNFNVDKNKIYVIGFSGGGFSALSAFMKSKHNINTFSAWASISDLVAWYNQSIILQNTKYATNIFNCTASDNELNIETAKQRSPLYWDTPVKKLETQKLKIYAGIYDGLQGSVPITHSINFYNKVLKDMNVSDSTLYISINEKLLLLDRRQPLGKFDSIGGRKVFLRKSYKNISITIFEGDHELLNQFALDDLLNLKTTNPSL